MFTNPVKASDEIKRAYACWYLVKSVISHVHTQFWERECMHRSGCTLLHYVKLNGTDVTAQLADISFGQPFAPMRPLIGQLSANLLETGRKRLRAPLDGNWLLSVWEIKRGRWTNGNTDTVHMEKEKAAVRLNAARSARPDQDFWSRSPVMIMGSGISISDQQSADTDEKINTSQWTDRFMFQILSFFIIDHVIPFLLVHFVTDVYCLMRIS